MNEEQKKELKRKYENGEIDLSSLSDEETEIICRLSQDSTRKINARLYNQIQKLRAEAAAGSSPDIIKKFDDIISAATAGRKKLRESFFQDTADESIGIDLYEIKKDNSQVYQATYRSYDECLCDLSFFYDVFELEILKNMFLDNSHEVNKPFLYRGVCTELHRPTGRIIRYVHYSNSLRALLYKFEEYEKHALDNPENFEYGAGGTEIYLFDEKKKKYTFYVGGKDIHNIDNIIQLANEKKKPVPESITDEKERLDVFISHKREDNEAARKIYNYLVSMGISAFFDDASIPKSHNSAFAEVIDNALEKAQNFILVASKPEYIKERWVHSECQTFANEFRNGDKKGNMLTVFTEDATAEFKDLPLALQNHKYVRINELDLMKCYIILEEKEE